MAVNMMARGWAGVWVGLCVGALWGASPDAAVDAAAQGGLSRVEALRLAEAHNGRLAAATCSVAAAEGRARQARLPPNPEIEVEVEDISGSAGSSVLGGSVTTTRLGQRLELGGKRAARARLAEIETELENWEVRRLRQDLRHDTDRAFTAVLAAQERLRLAREAAELAQRLVDTVSQRVQAGKDAPLELGKAKVEAGRRRIDLQRSESALETARATLAGQWGGEAPSFSRAEGDLSAIPSLPTLEKLLSALPDNPGLARWPTTSARHTAAVALARSGRLPDLTLAAGAAWSAADDEATFLVSASLPLQLFDRNQGAIQEAYAELRRAAEERRALEAELRTELVAAHQAFTAAQRETRGLAEEVLPEARRAMEAARAAYAEGKTGYLEVLDAQQTLFEAQMQYVDALAACHDAVAAAARLTGETADRELQSRK